MTAGEARAARDALRWATRAQGLFAALEQLRAAGVAVEFEHLPGDRIPVLKTRASLRGLRFVPGVEGQHVARVFLGAAEVDSANPDTDDGFPLVHSLFNALAAVDPRELTQAEQMAIALSRHTLERSV